METARRWLRTARWILAAALGSAGCSYVLAGDPLLGTAQSVAQGGCVAQCSPGYRCNAGSALCEPEKADAGGR